MKLWVILPISIMCLIELVSCSTDAINDRMAPVVTEGTPGEIPGEVSGEVPAEVTEVDNSVSSTSFYFGFLDGDGSSEPYIDMPIESSATNLLVGRWKIIKIGADERNDGTMQYYNYQDYDNKSCGESFLQFNNNGFVFENSFFKDQGTCKLYVETDDWELIAPNRLRIYVYDNIYIISATASELILKYDWNFANSLYAPAQIFYYYERVQKPN